MLVRKGERKKEVDTKEHVVYDYPLPSKDIGISEQELNGNVPKKGWWINKVCEEVCYVIGGSGKVFIDDENFEVNEGDLFLIKPNQKSRIEADNLRLVVISSPDWYAEQCENVKK